MKLATSAAPTPFAIVILVLVLLPVTAMRAGNAHLHNALLAVTALMSATALLLAGGRLFRSTHTPAISGNTLRTVLIDVLMAVTMIVAGAMVVYSDTGFFVVHEITINLPSSSIY